MSESISVMLVDDHELIRQGLARAFERDVDMHVVGQAGSVNEGLSVFHDVRPDVVVMQIIMNALQIFSTLAARASGIAVKHTVQCLKQNQISPVVYPTT